MVRLAIIVIFLLIAILAFPIGCTSVAELPSEEYCPDDYVEIEEITITSGVEGGKPVDSKTSFSTSATEVYCVIIVPDICCSILDLKWIYEGTIIKEWTGLGLGNLTPMVFSLESPPGGFSAGNYSVTLMLGDRTLTEAQFTVVAS